MKCGRTLVAAMTITSELLVANTKIGTLKMKIGTHKMKKK